LGGALAGAIGQSAPQIAQFAQSVTDNAAGLQQLGVGAVKTAGPLAQTGVQLAGPAGGFLSDVVAPIAAVAGDAVTGAAGRTSNMSGTDLVSKAASGTVTGLFMGSGNPLLMAAGSIAGQLGVPGFTSQTDAQAQSKPTFAPPMKQDQFLGHSSAHQRSPDAARFDGMTGAQVYSQEYQHATGAAPGQPHWSGVGPRGPGQSVGAMPPSVAPSLGIGSIAPLNALQSAMQSQVAGGGAQTGQSMVQHIQKAVNVAAPAASAGGAAVGGSFNSGMAQGQSSTQSVID